MFVPRVFVGADPDRSGARHTHSLYKVDLSAPRRCVHTTLSSHPSPPKQARPEPHAVRRHGAMGLFLYKLSQARVQVHLAMTMTCRAQSLAAFGELWDPPAPPLTLTL